METAVFVKACWKTCGCVSKLAL